jgi:prevent-host-death family protein
LERTIEVSELSRRFDEIFEEIAERHTSYLLTSGAEPKAALVSIYDYQRLRALAEGDVLVRFDRLLERMAERNAAFLEEEVRGDVALARGGHDLGELVRCIPKDNQPEEVDWGPPVGREVC